METHGLRLLGSSYKDPIASYCLFQKFSVENPEVCLDFCAYIVWEIDFHTSLMFVNDFQVYWSMFLKEISILFHRVPRCILDTSDKSKHGGTWLPGAVLNIAECCLLPVSYPRKHDNSLAIVWRNEGEDDSPVNQLSLKELREQVMYDFYDLPLFTLHYS